MREASFFHLEFGGVDQDTAVLNLRTMLEVQHLVKHDLLDDIEGHGGRIENAADENGVMRRIVTRQGMS